MTTINYGIFIQVLEHNYCRAISRSSRSDKFNNEHLDADFMDIIFAH